MRERGARAGIGDQSRLCPGADQSRKFRRRSWRPRRSEGRLSTCGCRRPVKLAGAGKACRRFRSGRGAFRSPPRCPRTPLGAEAADRAALGFALGRLLDAAGDYDQAFVTYADANRASRAAPGFRRYDAAAHEQFVDRLIATFDKTGPRGPAIAGRNAPVYLRNVPVGLDTGRTDARGT